MKFAPVLIIAIVVIAATRTLADTPHVFSLDVSAWQEKPKSVAVAGDFNKWSPTATPLLKKGDVWSAPVKLADGPHAYKFVVDKTRWLQDPKADPALDSEDGNGGKNSGVKIGGAAGAGPAAGGTAFSLDTAAWPVKPTSVFVAGDFNGWKTDATPLTKKGDAWSATVKLAAGVHAYKFVVDKTRWLQDPKADPALDSDDGQGGKNSGVKVGAAGPANAPSAGAPNVGGYVFALDTAGWDQQPQRVSVVGTFNGWNKGATPLQRNGNVWTAAVPLADGVYHYKFVVDGQNYVQDPKSDAAFDEDDTFGGKNSGVLVGPDARKLPAPKPNAVNLAGVRFDPKDMADLNVMSDHGVRVRVRVQADDVEHVFVRYGTAAGNDWPRVELKKIGTRLGYDVYGGLVNLADTAGPSVFDANASPRPGGLLGYYFEFADGTIDVRWANNRTFPTDSAAAAGSAQVGLKPAFVTPDWAQSAVWYQIFPERFRNGDPSNDPDNNEDQTRVAWTSKWFDPQPGEAPGAENFYFGAGNVWKRRYGGDIAGIKQELPYLKKLGVTAIYLNPIFKAESMHKYDTTDYRHVDDNFGVKGDWPVAGETDDPRTWKWSPSDKLFLDFVASAHAQGIRVVIDGVFNPAGRPNPFFQDVLEHGKKTVGTPTGSKSSTGAIRPTGGKWTTHTRSTASPAASSGWAGSATRTARCRSSRRTATPAWARGRRS